MRLQPRRYQQDAIEASARAIQEKRSTLLVMATGGGKTLVFAKILSRYCRRGEHVLVLANQREHVSQAARVIHEQTGFRVGIEMAGQTTLRGSLPSVVCGSVQSIVRRLKSFPKNTFALIVIDEADLAAAPTYRKITEHFHQAKVFGCTATPHRHDGIALSHVFESVAYEKPLSELVREKYLVPVSRRVIKVLELTRIRTRDGDFDPKRLDEILREERHLHEVARPTLKLAADRPTVVFCVSIAHAEMLAAVMNRYQPGSTKAVHSKSRDRDVVIGQFKRREFQFLCNCLLIGRAVDIPQIACVSMARPTKSLTLYMQALGRGTRRASGKTNLLVLDFTDNSDMHDIVGAIDALGGEKTPEERERAREIEQEEDREHDVTELLDRASKELAESEELRDKMRKKVRAKVRFAKREPATIDWPKHEHLLGHLRDREVAVMAGCSVAAIAAHRRQLKLPSFARIDWSKCQSILGTMSDRKAAKQIGCTVSGVQNQRKKFNIAPFAPQSGSSSSPPLSLPSLKNIIRSHIVDVLTATNNNKTLTAKTLGISRSNLLEKIQEFDLTSQFGGYVKYKSPGKRKRESEKLP